jgi:flagellar protein FliO/FliZ
VNPWIRLLSGFALWLPALALAAPVEMEAGQSLGRMLLGLVVVIGLVVALAWVARRFSLGRLVGAADQGPIRMIAARSLGARERLALVEVDGERMLLGIVPGRITRLSGGSTRRSDPDTGDA